MFDGVLVPPLLTGHPVKPPARCIPVAVRGVTAGRLGAADVVWSRRRDRAELAIVLEPEVPLDRSLQMLPLAVVATGEALGALSPPQAAVTWRWPGEMRVNGGRIGAVTAVRPPCDPGAVPDWLVIGIDLALAHDARHKGEPGHRPDETTLGEEGFADVTSARLIEACLGHFLAWLDTWQDRGFRPVADAWLIRADGRGSPVALRHGSCTVEGRMRGLDEAANLLIQSLSGACCTLLLADYVDVAAAAASRISADQRSRP